MEINPTDIFPPLQNQYSDYLPNIAMSSRTFSAADFGAIAVLTEDQLLTAVRDHPGNLLAQLSEKLDDLRAEMVKSLVRTYLT